MYLLQPAVWFIVGATMRMRMVVYRMRIRVADASYSYTNVGSRLAFRGKLVRAESVEAYKAIREVL